MQNSTLIQLRQGKDLHEQGQFGLHHFLIHPQSTNAGI